MSKVLVMILALIAGVLGFIALAPAPKRAGPVAVAPPVFRPAAASPAPAAAAPAPAPQVRPQLPPLPPPRTLPASGVRCHEVTLEWAQGRPMRLFIFMPAGDFAPRSLPCILEAPAGTPLLHGADIGTADEAAAFLPFTEEGMITVIYSIDGALPDAVPRDGSPAHGRAMQAAYAQFTAAEAGVRNGRAAIDYVLARVPEADPDRLFTWGHSSAATLALLLAAKDDRLQKCVALAPCTELSPRLGPLLREPGMDRMFPGLADYLRWGAPVTHAGGLACRVFLAHARDDDNVPFAQAEAFVAKAKAAGRDVTFLDLPRGGHYQKMIELSLPDALDWLEE